MLKAHLKSLGLNPETVLNHLDSHLTLSFQDGVLLLADKEHPDHDLVIDFCEPRFQYRLERAEHELVVKACRIKNHINNSTRLKLLDATCGLGRDAMLLQLADFQVTACERHPILAALLADGLHRLPDSLDRFTLCAQDAREVMQHHSFDVIYLDPMFAESRKSAKVKKGMQILQQLHHKQINDSEALFEAAWLATCQRLVVKRGAKAATINAVKPTFQLKSKTCRFDVYQRS